MSEKKSVFISYKHIEPDTALAHALAERLKGEEHEVFIDTGIRWGQSWVSEIEKALKACDYLLLLLSEEAAYSEMVIEEVTIAKELAKQSEGKPTILPLRLNFPFDKDLPYNLAAYLRSIHQMEWNGEASTSQIEQALLEVLSSDATAHEWTAPTVIARPPIAAPSAAPTGGALRTDSPYYITRDGDERALRVLRETRQVVSIKGARQSGKTSLLVRLRESFRQVKAPEDTEDTHASALVDLQLIEEDQLDSLVALWRAITDEIALELDLDDWFDSKDRDSTNYRRLLNRFLERFVFTAGFDRLVICLDEVDRLFQHPKKNDFFGSIRGLFNQGASDPSWGKVAWVLASSTEPAFFIEDNFQSPFNIGERIELPSFSQVEMQELAGQFGFAADDERIQKVAEFTGGRPYISNLCFFELQSGGATENVLQPKAFASHLHRYLLHFREVSDLSTVMKDVVKGRSVSAKSKSASKLMSTGLVVEDSSSNLVPAATLYRDFFKEEL